MNFTESFQEFSSKLSTTDLALYAGVALVAWVLLKEKLSPVQKLVGDLVNKVKSSVVKKDSSVVDSVSTDTLPKSGDSDDLFFRLVASWKQTRNLAVQSGCQEAVKVADQMFPFLSPTVCAKKE